MNKNTEVSVGIASKKYGKISYRNMCHIGSLVRGAWDTIEPNNPPKKELLKKEHMECIYPKWFLSVINNCIEIVLSKNR